MLRNLFRKVKYHKKVNQKKPIAPQVGPKIEQLATDSSISKKINENLEKVHTIFKCSSDVSIRNFSIGKNKKEAFIVNIEGLSDKKIINENILGNLMTAANSSKEYDINIKNIKDNMLSIYNITTVNTLYDSVEGILNGNTLLFLDGEEAALEMRTHACEHRNVEMPQTESTVRGPHEGFTETLSVNIALVRRKIKNADLKIEEMKIGLRTRTDVCIIYLDSLADCKIVEEVNRRLRSIEIDAILESGYIEDFIEDAPFSLFPTVGNTERPDKFAANILEGRVGILVDGSPMALTVPFFFIESLHTVGDYYSGTYLSSFLRLIRFLALHLTLFLPALYVALSNFHPDIVPERLLITMQVTREGIPFPSVVEALGMGIMFDVLREAGVRMPRAVG